MHSRRRSPCRREQPDYAIDRHGSIVVLSAVMLVVIFACVAFAVDVGVIALSKSKCQKAADAAAHAAAVSLMNKPGGLEKARKIAIDLGATNIPNSGIVVAANDVRFGTWDRKMRTFTTGGASVNAVEVVARLSKVNGNPVKLFFAPVIGNSSADVAATAIAVIPETSGPQFRFLLDDEMFDTDEPSIEELAKAYKTNPDALLTDSDEDGFIDMPPGTTVELPTGQQGDEALFDRTKFAGKFPFQPGTKYNTLDFLAEGTALESELGTKSLDNVEWTSIDAPQRDFIGKKLLDPTPGVSPMSNHQEILDLPNPNEIHVSPLFKSDVSMAEIDPSKFGSPLANLQGERRGLVAFKIISSRPNPNGGSYLPLLTIEILDPALIDLSSITSQNSSAATNRRPKLVR